MHIWLSGVLDKFASSKFCPKILFLLIRAMWVSCATILVNITTTFSYQLQKFRSSYATLLDCISTITLPSVGYMDSLSTTNLWGCRQGSSSLIFPFACAWRLKKMNEDGVCRMWRRIWIWQSRLGLPHTDDPWVRLMQGKCCNCAALPTSQDEDLCAGKEPNNTGG